jgi:N-acetyl-gamma-glutamyl-phosphate reductase
LIRVSAASGVSGAGRAAKDNLHFPHLTENFLAYKIGAHQHTAEIEQTLNEISQHTIQVSFTAHLLPIARGIFVTLFADCADEKVGENIFDVYKKSFEDSPCVHISKTPLDVKQVRGTNLCKIYPVYDARTKSFIITAVIDNLTKGASGQAIQNANLCLGLPEACGLPLEALYP